MTDPHKIAAALSEVDLLDPDYADGFWAFAHSKGFDADRNYDEQYCLGWQVAEQVVPPVRAILQEQTNDKMD